MSHSMRSFKSSASNSNSKLLRCCTTARLREKASSRSSSGSCGTLTASQLQQQQQQPQQHHQRHHRKHRGSRESDPNVRTQPTSLCSCRTQPVSHQKSSFFFPTWTGGNALSDLVSIKSNVVGPLNWRHGDSNTNCSRVHDDYHDRNHLEPLVRCVSCLCRHQSQPQLSPQPQPPPPQTPPPPLPSPAQRPVTQPCRDCSQCKYQDRRPTSASRTSAFQEICPLHVVNSDGDCDRRRDDEQEIFQDINRTKLDDDQLSAERRNFIEDQHKINDERHRELRYGDCAEHSCSNCQQHSKLEPQAKSLTNGAQHSRRLSPRIPVANSSCGSCAISQNSTLGTSTNRRQLAGPVQRMPAKHDESLSLLPNSVQQSARSQTPLQQPEALSPMQQPLSMQRSMQANSTRLSQPQTPGPGQRKAPSMPEGPSQRGNLYMRSRESALSSPARVRWNQRQSVDADFDNVGPTSAGFGQLDRPWSSMASSWDSMEWIDPVENFAKLVQDDPVNDKDEWEVPDSCFHLDPPRTFSRQFDDESRFSCWNPTFVGRGSGAGGRRRVLSRAFDSALDDGFDCGFGRNRAAGDLDVGLSGDIVSGLSSDLGDTNLDVCVRSVGGGVSGGFGFGLDDSLDSRTAPGQLVGHAGFDGDWHSELQSFRQHRAQPFDYI